MTTIRYSKVKDQWPWMVEETDTVYRKGKDPAQLTISLSHTPAGTGYAEIDPADAKLTALTGCYIVSSDVADIVGATGATSVTVFGCSGNTYYNESHNLSGATDVGPINLDGAFHMHVDAYGAAGCAVGDITLHDGTTTYLTIPSGSIDSNGTHMRLLDGYKGAIQCGNIKQLGIAGPTTAVQMVHLKAAPSGMASTVTDDNEELGAIFSVNAYEGQTPICPEAVPTDGPWDGTMMTKYVGSANPLKIRFNYVFWED